VNIVAMSMTSHPQKHDRPDSAHRSVLVLIIAKYALVLIVQLGVVAMSHTMDPAGGRNADKYSSVIKRDAKIVARPINSHYSNTVLRSKSTTKRHSENSEMTMKSTIKLPTVLRI
jgi:hypothetical protein